MKKLRLLTTFMATTACVVPAIPSLATLTSCSNASISEVALKIKDDTIQTFMTVCRQTHRSVWNEQEAFDFVVSAMNTLGYRHEAGRDYWSYVPEVAEQIEKETGIKRDSFNFPSYGNIWYDLPASEGMEDAPKVILQAHLDSQMTFADDAAKQNWLSKGIDVTYDRDNDIIHTDGKTSLGADGGMGISMLLSIAKYTNSFKHGGIRLLFTAGESEATQHYAAGASFLENDQNSGGKETWEGHKSVLPYMLPGAKKPFGDTPNEFNKIISISGLYNKTIYRSVGGISEVCFSDKELSFTDTENQVNKPGVHLYTITIDNLHGGKSSKDINSGYANALEMMMKTIHNVANIQIISASSQPGAYNIAKTATATFVSTASLEELNTKKNEILNTFKQSCKSEDWKNVTFEITQLGDSEIGKKPYVYGLTRTQSTNFVDFFASEDQKWGATEWFDPETKNNVKTSYNHGKLSLTVDQAGNDSSLEFYTILRTNNPTEILGWDGKAGGMLRDSLYYLYSGTAQEAKAAVLNHKSTIINPPWEGTENNKLIDLIDEGYKKINITPKITDNHGWVEVGCFPGAYQEISPNMEMACLGIEINNSQELTESVYTDSLNTLNKALIYSLVNIKKAI